MGFDVIVIALFLLSCCRFFFVFGLRLSFFGGFQYPPVDNCSIASCNFGALTGGDELMFFYSAILNQKPLLGIFDAVLNRIVFVFSFSDS